MLKTYKIVCKLCGKTKEAEYPKQVFCSRKCSGKFNIKKRVYKRQNGVKVKLVKSDIKVSRTYTDTIDKGIVNKRYRAIKYPIDELELFKCIKNKDTPSRPAIIKIIKASKAYQLFIQNLKKKV